MFKYLIEKLGWELKGVAFRLFYPVFGDDQLALNTRGIVLVALSTILPVTMGLMGEKGLFLLLLFPLTIVSISLWRTREKYAHEKKRVEIMFKERDNVDRAHNHETDVWMGVLTHLVRDVGEATNAVTCNRHELMTRVTGLGAPKIMEAAQTRELSADELRGLLNNGAPSTRLNRAGGRILRTWMSNFPRECERITAAYPALQEILKELKERRGQPPVSTGEQ